jgi:hypothetical protein
LYFRFIAAGMIQARTGQVLTQLGELASGVGMWVYCG